MFIFLIDGFEVGFLSVDPFFFFFGQADENKRHILSVNKQEIDAPGVK